nr:MAG TPA: hypothetical protein [Caudoviricetes sp.]
MHDMHTNTMHHAWCNAWYKGNTQRTMHKHTKQCKKQKKCYKNMQKGNFTTNNGVQKNHGNKTRRTKRGPHNHKGSLKVGPTPQNKTGNTTKRDTHHTFYVMGATPPPPSGREHPEGLPIPPCLWKTLWITSVTQITM